MAEPGRAAAPAAEASARSLEAASNADTPADTRVRLGAALAGAAAGAGLALAAGHATVVAVAVIAAFTGALALASAIDLREHRIPNWLNGGGFLVAVTAAGLVGGVPELVDAVMGALFAGGVMFVAWIAGGGRLGMGDVKLAAFAGAVLGPVAVPAFLAAGILLGAAAALALLVAGRGMQHAFAYGPPLAVGALIAVLIEGPILS